MGLTRTLKYLLIGKPRSPKDQTIFHTLSLVVFFAWVGLGVDGLSSSCYGPEETFLALGRHTSLAIFVALFAAITIFVISASYSQIIELFPTGGGGYLVASKLLSPSLGMVSGCALLVDYVLTITISIASGADALFSFLPPGYHAYKLEFAAIVLLLLVLLNLRGAKESVLPLVPLFLLFVATHAWTILYGFLAHARDFGTVVTHTTHGVGQSVAEMGVAGTILLILRAYSMGAGTYTGIEAVSNGIPILREPKVRTAKHTMRYMAISLAFMVVGLTIGYLLFRVHRVEGKTLNAVLLESVCSGWNPTIAQTFILVTLISETVLLFAAGQTGFLGGPRVLANMALDRWMPTRFSVLSDRLVTHNGIVIIGALAMLIMVFTHGSVALLVVLYSINVFITFFLSQLAMVKHWWMVRRDERAWRKKLCVNGVGLVLTTFILISVTTIKFFEGGWVTLAITGSLIGLAILTRRHYAHTGRLLRRLDELVARAEVFSEAAAAKRSADTPAPAFNPKAKTAVMFVSGFNGTGLHTLFNIVRLFGESFKNFIFVEVGILDVGTFKGPDEVGRLQTQISGDLDRYVRFMRNEGFYAEGMQDIGVDVAEEAGKMARVIQRRFPGAVFFGGKLVFPNDSALLRLLHNQIVFAVQKRLYQEGIPFVILPIRINPELQMDTAGVTTDSP
jgi:amino acid transporter